MGINHKTEGDTPETIGWRIGEAAEFLVNLLAGEEIPAEENITRESRGRKSAQKPEMKVPEYARKMTLLFSYAL